MFASCKIRRKENKHPFVATFSDILPVKRKIRLHSYIISCMNSK